MHDDNERNIALRVWFRKMIKWASYHTINPLQKRLQPSITTTLPPIADNLLPVMGDNIPEPFYQSSNNPPQLPSSPPTADKLSSVVEDNLPFDDTISMYNPSQVSVSPTTIHTPPRSYADILRDSTTNHTPPRSYADILRDSSTISTTFSRSTEIPIKQQSLSHLSHSIIAPTKTRRTFSSYSANTLHTSPVSTKTLSTNDIPIIRGASKDYSVLLSLDTDATKETFFINLQPIIQRLVEQKASKEDMLTSVTTFLKELALPTIKFSIKDQPESFQSRYYATNPNGACGYILAYQLHTRRKQCSTTPLDLYNSTTRSQFVRFLQQQLHLSEDIDYTHKLSATINWVNTSFNPITRSSTQTPILPRKYWALDDIFLRFNLHTTFTYFTTSDQYTNYLKCMFSSSTTHRVHYTFLELLSMIKTKFFIQYCADHFFFLEDPKPTILLTCMDEAISDLAANILTYFLENPIAINATIKYHATPYVDLTTPTPSPTRTSPQPPSIPPPPSSTLHTTPTEVPMNAQARAFLNSCQQNPSSSIIPILPTIVTRSSGVPTQPTADPNSNTSIPKLPKIITGSSGVPTPPTTTDPTSNTILFRYVNDPIFKSIRPFFYRISENARKREAFFDIPPTQCTTCMQFFTKMGLHTSNSDSITGCYNVARLCKYICLRKNISLPSNTYPSELENLTVTKLESHLMELN